MGLLRKILRLASTNCISKHMKTYKLSNCIKSSQILQGSVWRRSPENKVHKDKDRRDPTDNNRHRWSPGRDLHDPARQSWYHKPPMWEWLVPPIDGDSGDGIKLMFMMFYPHGPGLSTNLVSILILWWPRTTETSLA